MVLKIYISTIFLLLTSPSLTAENQEYKSDSLLAIETLREGINYARDAKYFKAIKIFNESLFYNQKLYGENNISTGNVYNVLGITYKNIGDLDNALKYSIKAEQSFLSDPKTNQIALARIYNNIGNVFKAQLNHNTALNYYQRAINIFEQQDNIDKQGLADIYYSVAITEFALNDYNQTLQIIDKHIENSYSDTKLYFLSLKAASLKELNRTKDAYQAFQEVIDYAENYFAENDLDIIFEYINFATFLTDNN
ncbi:MAG: tetratricopeptide repeat protein, partial [Tangfeifania sp.]